MKRITFYSTVLLAFILFGLPAALVSFGDSPAPPSGNALLLSDVHFDPLADPAIVSRLISAPASEWEAIFDSSAQTDYARCPHDTNYPLLKSALSAAAGQNSFDFVVASGDYLRHDFQTAFVKAGGSSNEFPVFATKAAVFVVNSIQAT